MNKIRIILVSVFFLLSASALKSQIISQGSSIKNFHDLDLLEASIGTFQDSVKKKNTNVKFVMRKSPLKAVLLSAALPGLGQFYNESYWKLPIVALVGGYFGYEILHQNSIFHDYRDQFVASQTPENQFGDQQILTLRNFYKDQRDRFIFYFGIFYVVNLVDAYVDAHLYDFDVSDKIKLGIEPSKLNLKINF